jgi:hypothetical protein
MHPGAVLWSLLSLAAAGGVWCWMRYERSTEERARETRDFLISQEHKSSLEKLQKENDDLRRQLAESIEAAKPPPTAAEIAERVRAARELAFSRVPEFAPMQSEEILRRLGEQATAGITPEMVQTRVRAALAMGFADTEFDYLSAVANLAQSRPGGFYDETANRFYYQSDSSLARADSRELFAGALLPVLVSQNFASAAPPLEPDNDDALLARLSLFRGDASFHRVRFTLSDRARANFDKGQAPAPPPVPSAPQFLMETWKWSEDAGNLLVQELHQKGGLAAVNAAYSRPPRSSAEILHMRELYLGPLPFDPVRVTFPDTSVNGVAALFSNVAGEAGAFFLVRKYFPVDEAEAATAGWAGDRYVIWQGPPEHGDHLLWRTVWITEKDAEEFFAVQRSSLMSRHLIPRQKEYDAVPRQFRVDEPHRIIRLQRDGKTVNLLNATDPAFAKAAEAKFLTP